MPDLSWVPRWVIEGRAVLACWAVLHFALAVCATWWARGYALRNRLIDLPGERRSHDVPTPRGGGIAIVLSLLVASGGALWFDSSQAAFLGGFGSGLILIAGVGWLDDHRPLPASWRLAVHAVAALLLAWGMWHQSGSIVAAIGAFVASIVLVNVWNFMDGIDALAASQALLVALGLSLLAGSGATLMLAVALAAACAGFLPFNLPKARIFLGDVGSGALGYAVAALTISIAARDLSFALALLLPLSAFLVDATLTLATRVLRGQRWWLPHAEHAYQRWTHKTRSHGVVMAAYATWTLASIAVMVALAAMATGAAYIMCAVIGVYLGGTLVWVRLQAGYGPSARGSSE